MDIARRGEPGYTEVYVGDEWLAPEVNFDIQPNNAFQTLGDGSVYVSISNEKSNIIAFLTTEEAEVLELALYDARVNGTNGWNYDDKD